MPGTDGREHIDYNLLITNGFTADVTLRLLEVLDGRGQRLLMLEGEALAAVTFELWTRGGVPTLTVPRSGVVATVVDVAVPPRAVPTRLTHRISQAPARRAAPAGREPPGKRPSAAHRLGLADRDLAAAGGPDR